MLTLHCCIERRLQVGRDHLRLERLELVVRIVGPDEDRLAVVEADADRRNRERRDIARDDVPVAEIVQLQLAEERRRLAERVGEAARGALVEHAVAAAQHEVPPVERRPCESDARHDVVVVAGNDGLAVGRLQRSDQPRREPSSGSKFDAKTKPSCTLPVASAAG